MNASTSSLDTVGPGVEGVGCAVLEGEGETVFCDVADVNVGGAGGAGGLGGDDADRASTGDQDPAAGIDPCAFAGPQPY